MVRTYNDLYRRAKQILEPMDGDLAGVAARELLCLAAEKTKEELLRDMGLYGAIIGKAYYAGTLDLAEAIREAGAQC